MSKNKNVISFNKTNKSKLYSKKRVEKIIKDYNNYIKDKKKKLVICHGHIYNKKYKDALLLNRENEYKPNIVSNAWDEKNMKYLPKDYFDIIIMAHCPISNPFGEKNNSLWKNLYRILKKGGKIINSSILPLYSIHTEDILYNDMKKIDKLKIKRKVKKHIKKMKFKDVKYKINPDKKGDEITIIIK